MKNIHQLRQSKFDHKKISMVTCYDYWSAKILSQTPVDLLLVGDSVSMVVHGYDSTIHATIEMMETHTSAVYRAQTNKLIVSDLPFLSHRKDTKTLMTDVHRLMKAGAGALKMETAPGQEKQVQWIVESGVPVIGHVGLTPQFVHQFGGYKVQGKTEDSKKRILEHSLALQNSGCSALVLECVPNDLAETITNELHIPTIGIGAGQKVDGQVLVLQDLLGFNNDFKPRFVREFAQGTQWMEKALTDYTQSIDNKSYPSLEESFQ